MPRALRVCPGNYIYHALNRANDKNRMFRETGDYLAFEELLNETQEKIPMRVLAYCLMPTHWHFVLWPLNDGDLSTFIRRISQIHAQRYRKYRQSTSQGHLYQGRFKSFPVQEDGHFLALCRYVEQNPLRAGLVDQAQDWQWSSLWRNDQSSSSPPRPKLHAWPLPRPENWLAMVNEQSNSSRIHQIQNCIRRDLPLGTGGWLGQTVKSFGLVKALRPRGRPRGSS